MNNYYVYTYSYPNGVPFYVGIGTGRRARVHLCEAKAGRRLEKMCIRVIRKMLTAGEEPIITKIINNIDKEFAVLIEQEFIAKHGRRDLNTGILTNCTNGGDGTVEVSADVKRKKTQALLTHGTKTRFQKGHVPANKGQPKSAETKEKIRQAHLGRTQSEETKKKKSAKLLGRKLAILICPHCNKSGGNTLMKRWHFDNCKVKVKND